MRHLESRIKTARIDAFSMAMLWPAAAFLALLMLTYNAYAIDDTKRQKVIDFEDEVVEGVNKRPLDSLNQVSDADRKKHKPHLYRKRGGFRSETAETLRALRLTP